MPSALIRNRPLKCINFCKAGKEGRQHLGKLRFSYHLVNGEIGLRGVETGLFGFRNNFVAIGCSPSERCHITCPFYTCRFFSTCAAFNSINRFLLGQVDLGHTVLCFLEERN